MRHIAALISLAVVFSGSFALSTQSVEAKNSKNSSRNYFVPPPPPNTPSVVPTANAQSESALVEKANSKSIFTHNQGDSQEVQANSYVGRDPGAEKRVQNHIDNIDSEISSHQKEIGKLLGL